jgi:hypothetical protein
MEDKKDAVASKASSAKEKMTGASGTAGENGSQAAQAARKSAGIVNANPLGLAIGSVATGFLLGMLLPPSRVENERIGRLPIRSRIRHGKSAAKPLNTDKSSPRTPPRRQPRRRRKPVRNTPRISRTACANLLAKPSSRHDRRKTSPRIGRSTRSWRTASTCVFSCLWRVRRRSR